MKICPACGNDNKDRNKFCVKCGTKFAVILQAEPLDDSCAFENEETMILGGEAETFDNEETVVIDDVSGFENEETMILGGKTEEPPKAPDFRFEGEVPVYRDPQNDVESETAYIDHLRRLKGLLDDGIINEREYEQKKEQILRLEE